MPDGTGPIQTKAETTTAGSHHSKPPNCRKPKLNLHKNSLLSLLNEAVKQWKPLNHGGTKLR